MACALKRPKLTYTFHNPNTVEATADFLVKLFVEVNQPKLEEILRRVQEESGQELPKTGT